MPIDSPASLPRAGIDYVIDGHLDLSTNVFLAGRDELLPAHEIRAIEKRQVDQATASVPDLKRGRIGIVFGTLWAMPKTLDLGNGSAVGTILGTMVPYGTPEEAEAEGLRHVDLYRRWADAGHIRLINSKSTLFEHLRLWREDGKPGLMILMEGADLIVKPDDVEKWKRLGLRIVGLSWGRTRYAGGTGAPGGLTQEGRELVAALKEAGLTLDTSHLAEESFWDAMEIGTASVIASHSSPRSLVPGDRQISDAMIQAIGDRNGIVGLPMYNLFLDKSWKRDAPVPVTLAKQFTELASHVAGLIGWDRVAIGSDLDGGFGVLESPAEIDTIADLWRVGDALPASAREGVLGGNWFRFLLETLPD